MLGDNSLVLQMFANMKAGVWLRSRDRALCWVVHTQVAHGTSLFLCWVPSELNPVDPLSKISDRCSRVVAIAQPAAAAKNGHLLQFGSGGMKHVWTVGLPKAKPGWLAV